MIVVVVTDGLRARFGSLCLSTCRHHRLSFARHAVRVSVLLVGSMFVAALMPHSELLFAITGALGVCAVCYALPVAMHLKLGGAASSSSSSSSSHAESNHPNYSHRRCCGWCGGCGVGWTRYAVPVATLAAGVCLSAMGLYSTLHDVG